MEEKKLFYLEKETGARFERDREQGTYILRFQASQLRLTDEEELGVYKECDPHIKREWSREEHELCVTIKPREGIRPYSEFRKEDDYSKLLIAHSLIQTVMRHTSPRLNVVVCPENLLIDDGLHINFIHYGVEESLPPYEKPTDEKLLGELRATLLVLLDGAHRFEEYLNYTGTLNLSGKAQRVLKQTTVAECLALVEHWIKQYKLAQKALHHVPKKKWTIQKWTGIGLMAALVPAAVYIVYVLAFLQPRQDAFTLSYEAYLKDNYSEVIDVLEQYQPDVMPKVVKYQLAQSYVAVERLKDTQRDNLQNILVLQAPEDYFEYWIAIGRGENEEAIDIARGLQDKEWIVYASVKRRNEITNDETLSGKEREDLIKEINAELAEYQKELEEMAEEEETMPASGDIEEDPSGEEEPNMEEKPAEKKEEATEKEEKEEKKDDKEDKGKKDGGDQS